jgi:PD-(D/E)XK endonuclease
MDRLINRRQQGDLGEASAIDWLTRQGATVSAPLGHSPDYDLIAEIDSRLIRVQVKTSTRTEPRHEGHRWAVMLATNGGNQSWSGVAKVFDPSRFDLLFVLVGDGRRWVIPADAIESTRSVNLGGTKYSEFEIDPGGSIEHLVYGDGATKLVSRPGEYASGQSTAPVKGQPQASQVRILPPPSRPSGSSFRPLRDDLKLGRPGQTTVGRRRLMTMPHVPFAEAGLQIGDRLRFRADGRGRLVVERIESPPDPVPARQAPDGRLVQPRH